MKRALAMLFLATPSLALGAETPWQEIAPDVRLRLIADGTQMADGTMLAGLEIDMPAGVKTYWHVPGQSGIPTTIDWSGSTGLKSAAIAWPFPTIETGSGLTDFVYRGPTVLPITLGLEGGAASLKANVVMGICSDICVPASASLSLDVSADAPDPGHGIRLQQALSTVPLEWTDEAPAFASLSYGEQGLTIRLENRGIDPESIIGTLEGSETGFGPPQKSPDGLSVSLPVLGSADAIPATGGTIHLTFMTDSGPYFVRFIREGQDWTPVLH